MCDRRADHAADHRHGISLIIFAGIVARLPTAVEQMLTQLWTRSISGASSPWSWLLIVS